MNTYRIMIAGFGGQGILFAGKIITTAGLLEGKEVSWLPSYGPEMRGGTANCSVCLSPDPICSPLVTAPEILLVMNQPSYEKFAPKVQPGGIIIADSSLIDCSDWNRQESISLLAVPATRLAAEQELEKLANMILLGVFYQKTKFAAETSVRDALSQYSPEGKSSLLEKNLRAFTLGKEFFLSTYK